MQIQPRLTSEQELSIMLAALKDVILAPSPSPLPPWTRQTKAPAMPTAVAVIASEVAVFQGLVVMLREEYPKVGSVFTLKLLDRNITFFIVPKVNQFHSLNA
ncbi:putative sterol 14-demethylase-like protein [Olea europaea var. sylvestris]|uniref:putative sterol 14-demethylase-like protein n=1 Tax=Olea europaea var. sylvestris TaxID=158386 RepID=UPI000C1D3DA4|nr:putative sterol 14-demethylase-like protein [Olea europaea var. sylvestris]